MSRCCQGSTCACVLAEGIGISIEGSGSGQDPFVISSTGGGIETVDNSVFNLNLTGDGSDGDPFTLEVQFAATAKLDDLPDVNAPAPTNGQVLSWNSGTSKWVAAAAPTAAPGLISTGTSLDGDGSVGDPLVVLHNATRFTGTTVTGIGLTDAGINNMVRHYANAAARTADPIAPDDNSLSMLDDAPGTVDYWDGAAWQPLGGFDTVVIGDAMFEISGPYVPGVRLTHITKVVSETTDGSGVFTVLDSSDLAGYAGVLSCQYSMSGDGTTNMAVVLTTDGLNQILGVGYRLTTGAVWAGKAVVGIVDAWVY